MNSGFEIREYIDENGNHIKDEMVDLGEELRGFQAFFHQQRENVPDDRKESMNALMEKFAAMNAEGSEQAENEDMRFLRDVENTYKHTNPELSSNDLSFLDRLELLEEEDYEKETLRKARQKEVASANLPKSGWKKGFLSGGNKTVQPKENFSLEIASDTLEVARKVKFTQDSPPPLPATTFTEPSATVAATLSELTAPLPSSPANAGLNGISKGAESKRVGVNKAFTGMVIERGFS